VPSHYRRWLLRAAALLRNGKHGKGVQVG